MMCIQKRFDRMFPPSTRLLLPLFLVTVFLCSLLHAGCTLHVYGSMDLKKKLIIDDNGAYTSEGYIEISRLCRMFSSKDEINSTSKYCDIADVTHGWRNGFSDIDFTLVNSGYSRIILDVKDVVLYIEKGWDGKSPGPLQNPTRNGESYAASGAMIYTSRRTGKSETWLNEQVKENKVHRLFEGDPVVPSAVFIEAGGSQEMKVLFPVDFYSRAYVAIPYTVLDNDLTKEMAVFFFILEGTSPDVWKERIEETD